MSNHITIGSYHCFLYLFEYLIHAHVKKQIRGPKVHTEKLVSSILVPVTQGQLLKAVSL